MILITGAAGFIGSALVAELNKLGRTDLVLVDRLDKSSKWMNLRALKFNEYIDADDLMTARKTVLDRVDFVFHLGACSSTTELDMNFLMKNNVNYSQDLFIFATEKSIPIVYASSAATYGAGENGYDDSHELVESLRPLNPYGYSKQYFDQWVLARDRRPDHWFGVKFFNVFGPQEYHKEEMRSLVHKSFQQIQETGSVKLFKSHRSDFQDGQQLRDFIYIKDVVRALIEMMNPSAKNFSGLMNLGTGQARSFYDLVQASFMAMARSPRIDFIDMPLEIRDQYQYYTQAKMDKFHQFLPTFQFATLEHSVNDYINQHLMKNPYLN